MAKPRPVSGLDPTKRLKPNARRILAVRIAEVHSYDGYIADPVNIRELHDMRIAFKRLRYLLEIFAPAFSADLRPHLETVKGLQDLLGDIHDRDVQLPMLRDHLEWLDEREHMAMRRAVSETLEAHESAATRKQRRRLASERAYHEFRERLRIGSRADERIGVHALMTRRRQERNELYHRFLDEWRRLKHERFRASLEKDLGIARG